MGGIRRGTLVACGLFCLAAPALAAEGEIAPTLTVGEEYSDNIFGTANDRRSDFVTRLRPGVAGAYRSPRLAGDLSYSFDYQHYARGTREDRETHYLELGAVAQPVREFLFVELNQSLRRVSLDVARDTTVESLEANQANQSLTGGRAYLCWRFWGRGTLETGYRFSNTRYSGSSGVENLQHGPYAALVHAAGERLDLQAEISSSRVFSERIDYYQYQATARATYRFSEAGELFASAGWSREDYHAGGSSSTPLWSAGVMRRFGLTSAILETQTRYTRDPSSDLLKETTHALRVDRVLNRGAAGFSGSYSRFAAVGTGALDRKKGAANAYLRHDFTPRLQGRLTLTADRVAGSGDLYPYHLVGSAGADYSLAKDLSIGLSYTYAEYRRRLEDPQGARQTSRIVAELRKAF